MMYFSTSIRPGTRGSTKQSILLTDIYSLTTMSEYLYDFENAIFNRRKTAALTELEKGFKKSNSWSLINKTADSQSDEYLSTI